MIEGYVLSKHFRERMQKRGIEEEQVVMALRFKEKEHSLTHDREKSKIFGKNGIIIIVVTKIKKLVTIYRDNIEYREACRKQKLANTKKKYVKANYKELSARKREGRWKGGKYKTRFEKKNELRKKQERGIW